MSWIAFPDDPIADEFFGGKGAALRRMAAADLPVPPFCVVLVKALEDSLGSEKIQCLSAPELDHMKLLAAMAPSPELAQEIAVALARLGKPEDLYAVRSSACDEDGGNHSFAGQLDSFLFVPVEQVATAIAAVWRSAWSPRIRAYRQERHLPPPSAPAVILQRMVDAQTAGVAFAIDPVEGRWDQAVISAVWGLGSGLVGGELDADMWKVDRQGQINSSQIVAKPQAHRRRADCIEGVGSLPVEASLVHAPCLHPDQVGVVAALVRRASSYAGRPQDIEWALENNRIWLLQSRPITTLGRQVDPSACPALWDNSNIAESYSGITTPLTFSFARRAYEEVYRQFCRLMGVSHQVIEQEAEVFRTMIGLIQGRVYYDLLNWYRLLAMLPGATVNRGFMEQMMGLNKGLPAGLLPEPGQAGCWARFMDGQRLVRSLGGLVWNALTLGRQVRHFYGRLDEALAQPKVPLSQQRPDELASEYRRLEQRLLTRWDAPLVNDFFAMIAYGLLRKLCQKWCADADGTLQNDLIGGEGGIVSAEPAARIRAMGAMLVGDQTGIQILTTGKLSQIQAALKVRPQLQEALRSYLQRFGDRCLEELKLESSTLDDDPLPLLRAIGHFASRPLMHTDLALSARHKAERRVAQTLRWHPIRRLIFSWILRRARALVKGRENLRFERTRVFGRVRRIFVELGHRLAAVGVLEKPRDIFFLEVEEILGFLRGTASCTDLRGLAEVRSATFAKYRAESTPADRFVTRGWVPVGNSWLPQIEVGVTVESKEQRQGTGCCPGLVRGRVRVVRDPRGVELPAGTILVAERTDPGWIMLFPACAGLVVERGSLLSHSAIVARELGIPAVVGLNAATAWLLDGDLVELDGATGIVQRIAGGDHVE